MRTNQHNQKVFKVKAIAVAVASAVCLMQGMAYAAPGNTQLPIEVAHGLGDGVTYKTSGAVGNIHQTTKTAVNKWQDFSIGANATVNFTANVENFNSVNIVNSGKTSEIYGRLNAEGGNVFLANTAGVHISSSAQINVGSIYVTTKSLTDIQDSEFTNLKSADEVHRKIASMTNAASAELMSLGAIVAEKKVTFDGDRIVIDTDRLYANNDAVALKTEENLVIRTKNANNVVLGYSKAEAGDKAEVNASITVASGSKADTNGNQADPLVYTGYTWVSTLDELQNMEDNPEGYYALANSIDANYTFEPGKSFDPIGTSKDQAFRGRFDGLGFSIFALNVKKNDGYAGLFGYTDGATIRNVTLNSGSVTGDQFTGALVGYASNSTIENIINTQDVTGSGSVGGIIGYATGGSTLSNLVNVGTVQASGNEVGGIVGTLVNSRLQGTTYNLGAVIASDSSAVGGLVGRATNSTIGNENGEVIYNQLNVTGGHEVGGIVGQIDSSTVQNVANYGDISAKGSKAEDYQYHTADKQGTGTSDEVKIVKVKVANVGGIVGSSASTKIDGNGVIYSKILNAYNEGDVNVTQISGATYGDYYQAGNVGGVVGQAQDTAILNAENKENYIAGAHNVGGIVGYLSGSSTVNIGLNNGGDITATGARLAEPPENSDGFATERVRKQIGGSNETFLIGNVGGIVGFLSGEGAKIENSGNRGSVHSAEITDQSNVLTISKAANVGGIVGKIDASESLDIEEIKADTSLATVYNSYNTGDVQGYTGVGGIIGMMYNGAVSRSYNLGEIRSTRKSSSSAGSVDPLNMGGIVGDSTEWTNAKAVIYDVYNAGQIGDDKFDYRGRHVGGVVGRLSGDLEKAYNTADIYNGFNVVGGVVGYWTAGSVSNVFNTGNITVVNYNDARSQVGGLVGAADISKGSLTLSKSYNLGTIRSFRPSIENQTGAGDHSVAGFVGELVNWENNTTSTLTINNSYTLGNIFAATATDRNNESWISSSGAYLDLGRNIANQSQFVSTNNAYVHMLETDGLNEIIKPDPNSPTSAEHLIWTDDGIKGDWGNLFGRDTKLDDFTGDWRLYAGGLPILNDFRPYASEHLEGDDFKDNYRNVGVQYGTAYNPLLTILDATCTEIKSITLSWDDLNIAGAGGLAVYGADLTLTNFTQDAGSYFGGTIFTDGQLTIVSSVSGKDVMLGSASKLYGDSVTITSAGNDVTIYGSVTATGGDISATDGDISISGDNVEVIGQLITWADGYSESIDGVATAIEKLDHSNDENLFKPREHLTTIADNTSVKLKSEQSGSISITSENDLDLLYGTVGNGLIQSADDLTLEAKNSGSIFVDTMLDIGGNLSLTSDGEMLLDFSNIGQNKQYFHENFLDHFKDKTINVKGNGEFIIAIDMWVEAESPNETDRFDLERYDVSDGEWDGAKKHKLSDDIQALNLVKGKNDEGAKNYTSIWISSAEQLNAINEYKEGDSDSGILGYNFALKNDINGRELERIDENGTIQYLFESIGGDEGFSGTFNGRNYRIIGLTSKAEATTTGSPSNSGLFTQLNAGGIVKNLHIYASDFYGVDNAGAVAGVNFGDIDNVSTLGNNVEAIGSKNGLSFTRTENGNTIKETVGAAGGVAGVNYGEISNVVVSDSVVAGDDGTVGNNIRSTAGGVSGVNYGKISTAEVSSAVTAEGTETYSLGGVVGSNVVDGTIIGAINTGVTHARYGDLITSDSVGGIAGVNTGYIESVYNDGDITGGNYVGGIVGYNKYPTTEKAPNIVDAVNAGNVIVGAKTEETQPDYKYSGGLVGYNDGGVNNARNTGAIEGRDNVGGLVGYNAEGSTLTNLINGIAAEIVGLDNVGGIAGVNAGEINATEMDLVNEGKVYGNQFVGGIAGDNSGTIANVENAVLVLNITGSDAKYFGGIAGRNSGTIQGAVNKNAVTVEGGSFVGGIIGQNTNTGQFNGVISNLGNVSGKENVGGVIGENNNQGLLNNTSVERLSISNSGSVEASGGGAAGIFYTHSGLIRNVDLTNSGTVTGGSSEEGVTGGLFGTVNKIEVTDGHSQIWNSTLTNTGKVTGGGTVGGLIGKNEANVSHTSLINTGLVSGSTEQGTTGGLIGENTATIEGGRYVDESGLGYYKYAIYNNGTVIGKDNVGGLIGNNSGELVAAYNTGSVRGQTNVGGIVGVNSGTIDQAFNNVMTATNNGAISGDSNVGAIVGSNTRSVTNVYTAWDDENKLDKLIGSNSEQSLISKDDTDKWMKYGDDPILSVFLTSLEVKDKVVINGQEVTLQDYLQLTYNGKEQNVDIADLIEKGFIVAPEEIGMSAFRNTQDGGESDLLRNTDGQVNAGSYDNWLTSSQIAASGAEETFNPNNLGYNVEATFEVLKKPLTIDINDAETIVGVPPSLSGSSVSDLQGQLVGAETLGDFTFYIGLSDSANYNRVGVYEGQIGIWIDGTFYANQNGLDFESLASVFKNYLVNIGSGTLTVVEREGFDPEEVTDSYHNFNHLYREGWDEVRSQRERKAELHFIEGGMKIESN